MTPAAARGGVGAWLAYAIVPLMWGAAFIYTKWMSDTVTPMQVTLIRVASGFLPVLLFALVTKSLRWQHLRYLPHFLVMSVFSNSLYLWAIAAGTFRLETGIAGALTGAIPIFTLIFAVLVFRLEALTWAKVGGVIIGALGVVLIARPWSAGSVDATGVWLMLLAVCIYGFAFAYARRFIIPLGIPAAAGATYQMGLSMLTLLVITPMAGIEQILDDPKALWGGIIGLGVIGTGVTTILYYMLVRSLGAVTAATATYFPPLVAVVIGVALLGEELHPLVLIALVLLLSAALLTRTRSRRPNAPPPATT